MKLNKVNKNGSLSIILPKAITDKMIWHQGKEVNIPMHIEESVLITSQTKTITLEQLINGLQKILDSHKSLTSIPDVAEALDKNNEMIAYIIRYQLMQLLSKQVQ